MNRIKLVVTDVDGTLMTDDNHIPLDFFKVIEHLLNLKVKIIIASGRHLYNLHSLFHPYDDKIVFIAPKMAQ